MTDAAFELSEAQEVALRYIRVRCRACPSCGEPWYWPGSVNTAGHPNIYSRRLGKRAPGRREVFELCRGLIRAGCVVTTECENKRCLNPALLKAVRKAVVISAMRRRADVNLRQRVSLSRSMRERFGKLSDADVARLRLGGGSHRQEAAALGVDKSLVGKVRAGLRYVDFVSPFIGLAGGP